MATVSSLGHKTDIALWSVTPHSKRFSQQVDMKGNVSLQIFFVVYQAL